MAIEETESRESVEACLKKYNFQKTREKSLHKIAAEVFSLIQKQKTKKEIQNLASVLQKLVSEHFNTGKILADIMERLYKFNLVDLYTEKEVLQIYNDLTIYRQEIMEDIEAMSKINSYMKNKNINWGI